MITANDFQQIRVPFEIELSNRLYETLQGEMLESIIKEAKVARDENYMRYIFEGHSLKVSKELSPGLYSICQDIQKTLCFDEPIEYYISNQPEVNAFAIPRLEDDEPHIINLNSSLITLLDDDELRFIIGHEIGHLISRNANISKLISFVFPKNTSRPMMLQHLISLWDKFAELTADRFGLLACPDPEKCFSVFFKLASGLDSKRFAIEFNTFLIENEKRLEFFKENPQAFNLATHPINPIRVKAIDLFSKSTLWKQIQSGAVISPDEEFDKQTIELSAILQRLGLNDLDYHRMHYMASSGLLMAMVDKKMHEKEYLHIINNLSNYQIFPEDFLESLSNAGFEKVQEVFMGSLQKILELNPQEKSEMLNYLIQLAITDNRINQAEMELIFDLGTKLFDYSRKEIAQMIATGIQQNFMPKLHRF